MLKKETLKIEFLEIAPKVSEQVKLQACIDMTCSYTTMTRYLSGVIGKEPFANKLLTYLKEKVA